jgi:hypothetical protein
MSDNQFIVGEANTLNNLVFAVVLILIVVSINYLHKRIKAINQLKRDNDLLKSRLGYY